MMRVKRERERETDSSLLSVISLLRTKCQQENVLGPVRHGHKTKHMERVQRVTRHENKNREDKRQEKRRVYTTDDKNKATMPTTTAGTTKAATAAAKPDIPALGLTVSG